MADKFLRCEVVGSIANSITVKPYVDGAGIITVCQQDNILFDPDTLRAEGAEEMRHAALNALARTAREKFNLSDEYNHYLAGLMDGELAIKELPTIQPEERTEERTKTHSCDLIDRQAAQTELMMKCERYTLARESHGMGHVEWSSDLISVADAMDAIRDLPPAQTETLWVPISERMPRDGTWNIFTDGKNISVERYKADAIDHFFPNGRWFQLEDVIAWMPLPEAYKPNK